jgi:hypothetical protein
MIDNKENGHVNGVRQYEGAIITDTHTHTHTTNEAIYRIADLCVLCGSLSSALQTHYDFVDSRIQVYPCGDKFH